MMHQVRFGHKMLLGLLLGFGLVHAAPRMAYGQQNLATPIVEEDTDAVSQEDWMRSGVFAQAALGIGWTLSGVYVASRPEPSVSLRTGYRWAKHWSVAAEATLIFAGSQPLSALDLRGGIGNETQDYSMLHLGSSFGYAFYPTERLALRLRLGGGVTWFTPVPTDPNDDAAIPGSLIAWSGYATGGFEAMYATLLEPLSVGVSVQPYVVLDPLIVSVSVTAQLGYLF